MSMAAQPREQQAGLEARGRNSIPVQSPAPEGWELGEQVGPQGELSFAPGLQGRLKY